MINQYKNKIWVLVTVFLILLGGSVYWHLKDNEKLRITNDEFFPTRQECEQKTGKICSGSQMCDYNCPKNFKKGSYIPISESLILIDNVSIENQFPEKIVYKTVEEERVNGIYVDDSPYRKDCSERGGTFNDCGSPCDPKVETCKAYCAFTCELSSLFFKDTSDLSLNAVNVENDNRINIHQFPSDYETAKTPYPYIQRLTRSGDCVSDINLAYCKEFLELKYNGQIFIENTLLGVFDSEEMKKINELAQRLKDNIKQCAVLSKDMTQQVWQVDVGREQYIIDTMKCNELEQIGDLINKKVLEKNND